VPVRRMRVDVYDEGGNRYTISFEGRVTRDKTLRILDIVELLGGMPGIEPGLDFPKDISKIEKMRVFVERNLPSTWFSAKDAQQLYEKEIKEPIGLSTVSTYLSRLADRGFISKTRNSNKVLYRIVLQDVKKIIEKL